MLTLNKVASLVQESSLKHAHSVRGKQPKNIETGITRLTSSFERLSEGRWPLASRKDGLPFMLEGLRAAYAYSLEACVDHIQFLTGPEAMPKFVIDKGAPNDTVMAYENLQRASLRWAYNAPKMLSRFAATRGDLADGDAAAPIIALCSAHGTVAEIEEAMSSSLGDFAPHAAQMFMGTLQEYLLRLIANDEKAALVGDMFDSLQQTILLYQSGPNPRTFVALSAP